MNRARRAVPESADEGAGTVLVLGLVAVLLVGALATAALGGAAFARHRATTAADLAALAAAGAAWELGVPAVGSCPPGVLAVAARTAARNGARLGACAVGPGSQVSVAVTVEVGGAAARAGPARAVARAGPAPP